MTSRVISSTCNGVYGVSVATAAGALHTRNGIRNQDSVGFFQKKTASLPIVVAAADGHGGPPHSVRSHVGSKLACDVAIDVLSKLLGGHGVAKLVQSFRVGRKFATPEVAQLLEYSIPVEILGGWHDRVREHMGMLQDPGTFAIFRSNELQDLTANQHLMLQRNPVYGYGSTLTVAGLGGKTPGNSSPFLVVTRVGDGDALVVTTDGTVSWVFGESEPQVGERTDSLCNNDWKRFESRVIRVGPNFPLALVLISTDGYIKAHKREDIELFAQSIWQGIQGGLPEGTKSLSSQLQDHVNEKTAEFQPSGMIPVGDDVSLGLIYRCEPRVCHE